MLKARTCVKVASLSTLLIATIGCAIFGLLALSKDVNMKAGIMTLSFNFTNIQLPNNPFLMPHDFPDGDILQPLQTKAQSAADIAATAVPGAISSCWRYARGAVNGGKNHRS
ncbi:MAG: hypothetical protein M1839_003177 [Geoglossum umbratile]|nr:MAG: hypothetical protein M1839_003177 [Geoglossum umbratile]